MITRFRVCVGDTGGGRTGALLGFVAGDTARGSHREAEGKGGDVVGQEPRIGPGRQVALVDGPLEPFSHAGAAVGAPGGEEVTDAVPGVAPLFGIDARGTLFTVHKALPCSTTAPRRAHGEGGVGHGTTGFQVWTTPPSCPTMALS